MPYNYFGGLEGVIIPGNGTRISAVGSNGSGRYVAAVGYGGYIWVSDNYGATWMQRGTVRDWIGISVSNSGQYMLAITSEGFSGQRYVSNNYGATWNAVAG
ncbi:MAG: hypothetical protein ABIH23_13180, partial [bacterium]